MRTPATRGPTFPIVTTIVALVLLIAPSAAFASHIQSRFLAPDVPDPEFQSEDDPRVDGSTIYYTVSDWSFGGDVYDGYKWTIGDANAVAFPTATQACDIDNGVVLYGSGGTDIRATNGVADSLVCSGNDDIHPGNPCISGTTIVWASYTDGGRQADIKGATIDPLTLQPTNTFTVCAARGRQVNPAIDGDIVAWQDRRNGQWDIYARNLATERTKAICRARAEQDSPSVGSGWIAWVDWRNRLYGADVYACRWLSSTGRVICHARKAQKEVAVGDGFVVWTDYRNSASIPDKPPNTSLRGHDLAAHDGFIIDGGAGMQFAPSIDGHTVAYLDSVDTHMGMPWWCRILGAVLKH